MNTIFFMLLFKRVLEEHVPKSHSGPIWAFVCVTDFESSVSSVSFNIVINFIMLPSLHTLHVTDLLEYVVVLINLRWFLSFVIANMSGL